MKKLTPTAPPRKHVRLESYAEFDSQTEDGQTAYFGMYCIRPFLRVASPDDSLDEGIKSAPAQKTVLSVPVLYVPITPFDCLIYAD